MAITRVKTSSILQNFPKERSMLAGNDGDTGAYESIATVSLTSSTGFIEFTNIPSTFQHLQVRGLQRGATTGTGSDAALVTFNGDTANNYAAHRLTGNGSSASADSFTTRANFILPSLPRSDNTSNTFNGFVMDVLDYTSTNKNKTARILSGVDFNGSGDMWLVSGLWFKTPEAITSIRITAGGASPSFVANSHFALYGIR